MILGFISLFFSGESGRNEFATIPGMKLRLSVSLLVLVAAFAVSGTVAAFGQTQKQTQKEDTPTPMQKAPSRSEGEGPYPHLTLRNVTLIDGTGAPPVGPVDIIIEKNRIVAIQAATASRTTAKVQPGDLEMNLAGMYVLPGFINAHTHIGPVTSIPAEHIYKLWMAHGITTIREVWCMNGVDWVLGERERSAKNEITAPRIKAYCHVSSGHKCPITDAPETRKQSDRLADRGVDRM